jgi:hypothetical protein
MPPPQLSIGRRPSSCLRAKSDRPDALKRDIRVALIHIVAALYLGGDRLPAGVHDHGAPRRQAEGVTKQSASMMHTALNRPLTDDFCPPAATGIMDSLNDLIVRRKFDDAKNALPEGFIQRRIASLNYKAFPQHRAAAVKPQIAGMVRVHSVHKRSI